MSNKKTIFKKIDSMPLGIKFLFYLNIFNLLLFSFELITQKPVDYVYFGTNFPANFPIASYLFNIVHPLLFLLASWKRSKIWWILFVITLVMTIVVSTGNGLYRYLYVLPAEQKTLHLALVIIMFALQSFILYYVVHHKKYFSK